MVRDTITLVFWKGVATVAGLGTAIFLARQLDPSQRGEVAIVLLSLAMATMVMQLGIPEAMIAAIGKAEKAHKEVLQVLALEFSGLVALCGMLFGVTLLICFSAYSATQSLLITMSGGLMVISSFCRHLMLANEELGAYWKAMMCEAGVYFLLVGLIFSTIELTVTNVLAAYFVSQLAVLWFCGTVTRNFARVFFAVMGAGAIKKYRVLFRENFHFFGIGIGGFASGRLIYYLIDVFAGTRAVGFFAVASTLPNLIGGLQQQVAIIVFSRTANAGGLDRRVLLGLCVAVLGIASLSSAIIFEFGNRLIPIIFGDDYVSLATVTATLLLSAGIGGVNSLLINYLAALGAVRIGSFMTWASLFFVSVLGVFLIPRFGLEGAAISVTISGSIVMVFLTFFSFLTNPRERF